MRAPWLSNRTGSVLEIGAGTGQHAAAFSLAFPELDWWASDLDAKNLTSIAAWQKELRAPGLGPLPVDAATNWAETPAIVALGPLSIVLSMNVVHISPINVARGIVVGAGQSLIPGGLLIFYGPFLENGQHTGPGNIAFDESLRAKNPEWGIRDIAEITNLAEPAGLGFSAMIHMPANNRLLIFVKL